MESEQSARYIPPHAKGETSGGIHPIQVEKVCTIRIRVVHTNSDPDSLPGRYGSSRKGIAVKGTRARNSAGRSLKIQDSNTFRCNRSRITGVARIAREAAWPSVAHITRIPARKGRPEVGSGRLFGGVPAV